ncbi:hypothetical protein HOD83_02270 [Candidatus Woesearchaeota archaeon]|nr:hypothetical protein [Candidatus Woesearchaeota archaeon]MBT4114166.1 hypothetical protein [Candidatus Woesearchaeota archaeon]MBT4248391.1 hypothetical protein [Candidatus Woesearchaeota archaeon]
MKLPKTLRVYLISGKMDIAAWMEYRVNFLLYLIAGAVMRLLTPIVVYLIYYNGLTFPGWDFYQVFFLVGTFTFVRGFSSFITSSVAWWSNEMIHNGTFDKLLIRPMSPMKQLIIRETELDESSGLILGIILVIFSLYKMDVPIDAYNFALYVWFMILGIVFISSFDILSGALNFIFVKTDSIKDLFWESSMFGKYPLTIYGVIGHAIFTFAIPFGLLAFYPAEAFFGRMESTLFVQLNLITLAFLSVSLVMWKYAMTRYTSVGG